MGVLVNSSGGRLNETLTLGALPSKFASAAHSFCLLTGLLFRRLLEVSAGFHFTKQAFTLHLFLQCAKGLFDIIVANSNLNNGQLSIKVGAGCPADVRLWPIEPKTSRAYNMWKPACLSLDSDMSTPSEKLRERWLDALLPRVPEVGWSLVAAKQAAREAGITPGEQALAAPNGVSDLIDHFFDRAVDQMLETLAIEDLTALRTHERVAAGIRAWLDALAAHKESVRKAAGKGLLPWGAGAAVKRVWAIADAIWEAAGDTATDYNRQTKRALLSAVLPRIVLYWLDHEDDAALDRFIARRLQIAMKIGQTGSRVVKPVLDLAERLRSAREPRNL